MDRVKPLDLEKASFRTKFRGYEPEAVHALLKAASSELERLLVEVKHLTSENESLRREMETYRAQDQTLKETLVLAQRTAEETRAQAHKEAALVVEDARQQAREVQQEMQSRANDLRWEIERLHLERQRFISQFKNLLDEHLTMLNAASVNPVLPTAAAVEVAPPESAETPVPTPSGELH